MTTLEKELQALKTWDTVDGIKFPEYYQGYPKIMTCGHGYLAIRKGDINEDLVKQTGYSFKGEKAYYLEEDCEAPAFIKLLN